MKNSRLYKICRNAMAFTMVELVLVIALMAILAAAVVPAMNTRFGEASDAQRKTYYDNLVKQVDQMVTTYNTATQQGLTPKLAGYDISSARGMQECLRAANNHADVYDIELTTIASTPDKENYNYIDTIVVCIQFRTKSGSLIMNSQGKACSPEQASGTVVPWSCAKVNVWYIKKNTQGENVILYPAT